MNVAALTVLLLSMGPAQGPGPSNLDFRAGTLAGWRGHGFYVTTADPRGPSVALGVCSSDCGRPGHKGTLRYTFVVPSGASLLRCSAYAAYRKGFAPDDRLDVLLVTDDSEAVPKKVRGAAGWETAQGLLPRQGGQAREYAWELSGLVGRRVQIVLLDEDDRPGCYLFCSAFHLAVAEDFSEREFAEQVRRLEREKGQPPLTRFASRHFVAWSNADGGFTKGQIRNCEMIYQLFFEHFRRRGFAVGPPAAKLMVAILDGQTGFEAYLGQRMPVTVTGVYDRATNQLVLYDLGQNQGTLAHRQDALKLSQRIPRDMDKLRYLETIHRAINDWSKDGSLSTAMHETSHHLSFNCGMLNRQGDVPVWLCEGLACYCEATEQGGWQGVGALNRGRLAGLGRAGKLLPLRTLLKDDDWRQSSSTALLGYSQSWALFRLLMQERPAALRAYLALIYPRRAPEHRLTDFAEAFGPDLDRLEQRYLEYVRGLVQRQGPSAGR